MQKRVAFHTLGCKVNTAESDILTAEFQNRGYRVTGFDRISDIYVVNTCTVTHHADAQCRKIIRQARRKSPEALIAVIGCYAQADPGSVSKIPGVDLILGTREKFSIFDHLDHNSCFDEQVIRTGLTADPFLSETGAQYSTSRTRAFLKVQDGCSYKCSYCIIPTVRGPNTCRKKEDVIDKVKEIRDAGYNEIVLTAVNLGEYSDGSNYRLIHLLKDVCSVPNVPRIRLTSIEPNCLSEDLINCITDNERICNHFHIPLQNGSDAILRSMKRKYLTNRYARVMELIQTYSPQAAIGADVMVGFPGESDYQFRDSFSFVESMPITYLHVFRYSPRSGTSATDFDETVAPQIAHERSQQMIQLGLQKKDRFLRQQVGKTLNVLFESKDTDGVYEGFTRNYARVKCVDIKQANTIASVHISGSNGKELHGSFVPN